MLDELQQKIEVCIKHCVIVIYFKNVDSPQLSRGTGAVISSVASITLEYLVQFSILLRYYC